MVNIEDIDPRLVIAGLYNAAVTDTQQLHKYRHAPLNRVTAEPYINTLIETLKGRMLYVRIDEGMQASDESLYDHYNGEGTAQRVVDSIALSNDPNNRIIREIHEQSSAKTVRTT